MVRSIKFVYEFIFYMLYKYAAKSEKGWETGRGIPHWIGVFSLSCLLFINIITCVVIVYHYFPFSISLTKYHALSLILLLYYINYVIFIKHRKYLKLVKKFSNHFMNKKVLQEIFFWSYIILTFVLFFTILPMFATNKH